MASAAATKRAAEGSTAKRRSQITDAQKRILVIVCVAGVVLGVTSEASPTGHEWIDAFYRSVFLLAMIFAGSRARRWTLVLGSAICAAGAIGYPLLAAGAALALTIFLAIRDERDRIYGAVVGLLIGYAALELSVDLFLGSSLIVGLAAVLPIFFSAYKISRTKPKRFVRFALLAVVGLMALGTVTAAVGGLLSRNDLEEAITLTDSAIGATKSGDARSSVAYLTDAQGRFDQINARMTAPWMLFSKFVPVVSQNVEAVAVASFAGVELSEAAKISANDVDYDLLVANGGGINLEAFEGFEEPVFNAALALDESADSLATLDSAWYVGLLESKLDEFEGEVLKLRRETGLAALAVRDAPAILGADEDRRYLVLLGNPAELRDVGGHIGNWAEVIVSDGQMNLVQVGVPLDLANPDYESELVGSDYPESLLALLPARYPQNWGGSIDFPTDARLSAELYEEKTGKAVDGVLYADTFVFAAMLEVTGPISAPGLEKQITADNAADFLGNGQYSDYPDANSANAGVTQLVQSVFSKWTETTLPGPQRLGEIFGPLLEQSRIRFVSMHSEDGPLLSLMGLDIDVPVLYDSDLIAVINRNANPSKIDYYLERDTYYDVEWDSETGGVTAMVEVMLTNNAPAESFPVEVFQNSKGQPPGTNVTDLALVTPFELTSITQGGQALSLNPRSEGDMWRYTTRLNLAPGEKTSVVFELQGQVAPGSNYTLSVIGQPLFDPGTMRITVSDPNSDIIDGDGIEIVDGSAKVERAGDETLEVALSVDT